DPDCRNAIRSVQELRRFRRHNSGIRARVGAHVAKKLSTQADNRAVAPAGDFEFAVDFARVIGRLHMLKAVLDPFDRPTELSRGKGDQKIFRIEFTAYAKAAANIELYEVNCAFGHLHHRSERATVEERHLG